MVEAPGIYEMPMDEYHSHHYALSSSGAHAIMETCPAIYRARQLAPRKSAAMSFGSAAHEWMLEGETWPQRHFVLPADHDGRTKLGKDTVAAAKAEGLTTITTDEFTTIKAMKDALAAHPYAMEAFKSGQVELSMFWKDRIWRRCRPDFLGQDGALIVDYKTARSVSRDDIQRDMWDYAYAQRAAWYIDGIKALGLAENPTYLFIFQDKNPPYLVQPVIPEREALEWGEIVNRKAAEVFERCLETDAWPGYSDDIMTIGLPPWAHTRLQERSERGLYEITYKMQEPLPAAE